LGDVNVEAPGAGFERAGEIAVIAGHHHPTAHRSADAVVPHAHRHRCFDAQRIVADIETKRAAQVKIARAVKVAADRKRAAEPVEPKAHRGGTNLHVHGVTGNLGAEGTVDPHQTAEQHEGGFVDIKNHPVAGDV